MQQADLFVEPADELPRLVVGRPAAVKLEIGERLLDQGELGQPLRRPRRGLGEEPLQRRGGPGGSGCGRAGSHREEKHVRRVEGAFCS